MFISRSKVDLNEQPYLYHVHVKMQPHGEVGAILADPSAAIEIGLGPACPVLSPQQPGTGLQLARQCDTVPRRFIFKKAHLSREDFRIFDAASKTLVAVSHHHGKNPYESLDPLGVGHNANKYQTIGEMESLCHVTGYMGMPSFKVRPKMMSMHGRQLAQDHQGRTLFSVAKISRIKTMSLRHNLGVCVGEGEDEVYIVEADLMGRTLAFKNSAEELVAVAAKSTKALITSSVLGSGSEMILDVAPGVDWTAICAAMMVIQQVGAHYLKDLFEMFISDPLMDAVTDAAVEATGTQQYYNSAAQMTNQGIHGVQQGQNAYAQFNRLNQHY